MVIHCIDLVCSESSDVAFIGNSSSYVSVWLTNYTAWEAQVNEDPTLENSGVDAANPGIDYWSGGPWRFDWSEDKAVMMDNLEGQADAWCPWYRIRWHECDHEDSSLGGCEWDESETRTKGTIPDGI